MKKGCMKKVYCLATMSILLLSMLAHPQEREVRTGITAGPMFSSLRYIKDGYKERTDLQLSFAAGIVVDVVFNENFCLQPTLHYVKKGGRDVMETISLQLHYAELGVNAIYSLGENRHSVFLGAGPTLAIGISGKLKDYYPGISVPPVAIKFGNKEDEDHFKRFEFGTSILAGFYVNRNFIVTAMYNFGWSNLFINRAEDGRLTNRYWGAKAGWVFGR